MKLENPDIRYLYSLNKVIYDREWLKSSPNIELYYMYRDLKSDGNLRYDITIIPAKMLGQEYNKTKGHYHPGNYGETYTVLEGKAIYLMQKIKEDEIEDIYAVEAEKGESIIIPPRYGHITINPGKEDLKMSNWVCSDFSSIYEPIEEKGGAGYFYTNNGWIKNEKYKNTPPLRFEKSLKKLPEDLNFLRK
jgi:glucose-6-phosphate isomerase, archaeal